MLGLPSCGDRFRALVLRTDVGAHLHTLVYLLHLLYATAGWMLKGSVLPPVRKWYGGTMLRVTGTVDNKTPRLAKCT